MRGSVSLQRSIARLVILVMLAAALFPVLGHASASARGALGWVEVCTVGGVEVRSIAAGDSQPSSPALLVAHCPYCLVSSSDDALPVASAVTAVPAGAAGTAFPLLISFGASPPIWPAAQPRAPPAAA
jgi:hypothetical protein